MTFYQEGTETVEYEGDVAIVPLWFTDAEATAMSALADISEISQDVKDEILNKVLGQVKLYATFE